MNSFDFAHKMRIRADALLFVIKHLENKSIIPLLKAS